MTDTSNGGMSKLLIAKSALAVVGIAAFGVGIWIDSAAVRWAGIGFVAIAWFLRFAKRSD